VGGLDLAAVREVNRERVSGQLLIGHHDILFDKDSFRAGVRDTMRIFDVDSFGSWSKACNLA
jgi:hypothetical protein